jgi:hypothetical protein
MPTPTERHGHLAVLAGNDLWTIRTEWPALAALAACGTETATEPVKGSRTPPIPINPHVIDVMIEVETWITGLAHTLDVETNWTPPTTPNIRQTLAELYNHVGHFTEHPDPTIAQTFTTDTPRMATLVYKTAHPSGKRTLRVGVRCDHYTTTDPDNPTPCPGQYTVLADPDNPYVIPDLICDHNRTHRIDPGEWQRAYRRTQDPQAAAHLVARWRHAAEMIDIRRGA